jgi:hypothetical protein
MTNRPTSGPKCVRSLLLRWHPHNSYSISYNRFLSGGIRVVFGDDLPRGPAVRPPTKYRWTVVTHRPVGTVGCTCVSAK